MTEERKRGSSRKGLERREQILQTALEVFAEQGDRGTSFQEIADRLGVTQPSILYYFGTREKLLLAVLERRDQLGKALARQGEDPIAAAAESVRHHQGQPGLIRLFVALSAAATDPKHHAHDFFANRYRELGASITESLDEGQRTGWVRDDQQAAKMARLLLAVIDGLQIQWLMDPSIDMPDLVDTFVSMCMTWGDAGRRE